ADAAAALRALARLWQVRLGRRALADVARRLGADVPVCLAGRPAWVGGIGERQLRRAHHGRLPIVLVNPGVPLATTAVFRAFDDQPRPRRVTARHALPAALGPASALARYLAAHTNDLEAAATALVPAIADVLAALGAERGCRLARLSGSGPTCFGLFDAAPAARAAAARLRRVYPEWWAVPAHLQEHR
ncbi:MAG: 4-(cytidine 5'-diphospho)-2-C-methyl-D-erythritol kinase, partial [Alphaproteobacteria bacterium]|nr:4-(cytidine 5'-diphospho)-2-C-methyl-D-erythritol kinase [Alphaproteobacteria bacterium]